MIRLRHLPIAALMAFALPAGLSAQWGFRFSPLHYQQASGLSLFKQRHYTIGLDHDLNERLSIGLEALIGRANTSPADYSAGTTVGSYMGYSVDYLAEDKNFGVMYRCEYAFSDNDAFHGYLASTAGMVRVKRDLIISSVYRSSSYSYDYVDPSVIGLSYSEESSGMVFPLGLRFGLRSGLEGFYIDMYTGAGVNLGSKDLSTAPFMKKKEADMSGAFVQLGIALGFGG